MSANEEVNKVFKYKNTWWWQCPEQESFYISTLSTHGQI
jgi:hypothetical protein